MLRLILINNNQKEGNKMLLIGSHVAFDKDQQLVKSVREAISYVANTFMFYTGAPQNTKRAKIQKEKVKEAREEMKNAGIEASSIIVHAPYIINLANRKEEEKYQFSIEFLKEELKRVDALGCKYLVLHPGSHVGEGVEKGIQNIQDALNEVLENDSSEVKILLETMAGKGTEVGKTIDELAEIRNKVQKIKRVGICLDTCHLNDAGYNLEEFDSILDELEAKIGLENVYCVHINDSKNIRGAKKDRHENFGFGTIGFDTLLKIVYHPRLQQIPKILETPYIDHIYPPYREEIEMIRCKKFDPEVFSKKGKDC